MGRIIIKCDCGETAKYNPQHDAEYCEKCNKWLFPKCSDDECEFCINRPEKPINENKFYKCFSEHFETVLNDCRINYPKKQDELWIIKYNGERLCLPSKKSSWKRIGHAKNALRNALESYGVCPYDWKTGEYEANRAAKEEAYQDLIKSGKIKFIDIMKDK